MFKQYNKQYIEEILISIKNFDYYERIYKKKNILVLNNNYKIIYNRLRESVPTELDKILYKTKLRKNYLKWSLDHSNYGICTPIQSKEGNLVGYLCILNLTNSQEVDSFIIISDILSNFFYIALEYGYLYELIDNQLGGVLDNLTKKELEIVKLISCGKKDLEISKDMHISTSTLRTHIRNVFVKLSVNSRIDIARLYYNFIFANSQNN